MSLIKCPECGKEISDSTKQCIHCGYVISNENIEELNQDNNEEMNQEEIEKYDFASFTFLIYAVGIFSFVLLLLYIFIPLIEVNTMGAMITPVYFYEISIIPYIILAGFSIFSLISYSNSNFLFSVFNELGKITCKVMIIILWLIVVGIFYYNTQIELNIDSEEAMIGAMMNNIEISSLLATVTYTGFGILLYGSLKN